VASPPSSRAGNGKKLSLIAGLRIFRMIGVLPVNVQAMVFGNMGDFFCYWRRFYA